MRTSAKAKVKARPKSGGDDFESVARRLECDEDKARFEAKLGKIAKAKPTQASKR
jgi:hypothetical protein